MLPMLLPRPLLLLLAVDADSLLHNDSCCQHHSSHRCSLQPLSPPVDWCFFTKTILFAVWTCHHSLCWSSRRHQSCFSLYSSHNRQLNNDSSPLQSFLHDRYAYTVDVDFAIAPSWLLHLKVLFCACSHCMTRCAQCHTGDCNATS